MVRLIQALYIEDVFLAFFLRLTSNIKSLDHFSPMVLKF